MVQFVSLVGSSVLFSSLTLPSSLSFFNRQVGNSSNKNGQFKENLYLAAHAIRDRQRRNKTSIKI